MGRNYIEKVVIFLVHLAVFFACVKESQSHIAPLLSSRQQRGASDTDIVSRIARIPLIRTPSNDDMDFSSLKLGSLKSPGYNFHYRPHKLILPASSITSFSSENSQGTTESSKRNDLDSSNGFSEEAYMLDEESPTFTPYIGAHALSNMEKFFEHLRENLEAMQNDGTAEIDQPERRRTTSGEAVSYEGSHVTHEINSSPEGRLPPAMALQVQPQPSVTYKERSSYYIPSGSRLQKIQTFVQPLTEQQKYLQRANNYNPSWLWTNLGLGKRRRR